MLIGKVVGSVVSTRKCENLVGNKFMIVDVLEHMHSGADQLIAIDKIGAGIGERLVREALTLAHREGAAKVLLTSNAARQAAHRLYERVGFVRYDTDLFRYEF